MTTKTVILMDLDDKNAEFSGGLKALHDERLEEYKRKPKDVVDWETFKKN